MNTFYDLSGEILFQEHFINIQNLNLGVTGIEDGVYRLFIEVNDGSVYYKKVMAN